MKKTINCFIYSILSILLMIANLYAAPTQISQHSQHSQFLPANKVIKNLDSSIRYVKKHSTFNVLFPAKIPKDSYNVLFAFQESYYNNPKYDEYWNIFVTFDHDCTAVQCIIGSIQAKKSGRLYLDYQAAPYGSIKKTILKEKVKLVNHIIGYYTPGHAEADWHSPQIEWKQNNILYILSWEINKNPKRVLNIMANSALSKK